MRRMVWIVGLSAALAVTSEGCRHAEGPELAQAGGTVTYNGEPVKGANVVFMPDNGPAAYGVSGPDGRFTWMTRDQQGATVGSGKVAITAYEELDEPKDEQDLTAADLKKMSQSRIPVKYGRVETSGLTAVVKSGEENNFTFALTD